ncbi:MAG TPA: AbrB/MazE/SpoVT family DNA-binding domain-containing protein [Aestuariivirgaceae bacterium]|jgi:antitoxin MazE|nr:AbrB/MazE/SpoVT family DNA-binding domain-containing protein [Aestuariivirgaceae bacterium]
MTRVLKVQKIGNSLGYVLPKEVMVVHGLSQGDQAYLTMVGRQVVISPYDPDFAEQIEIGEKVQKRFRNALRKLAK